MLQWHDDLRISDSDLYLDSRRPRSLCFVSHAHSDHIAPHDLSICSIFTEKLLSYRIGPLHAIALQYQQPHELDANTQLHLRPAGHVPGSAMLHVQRDNDSLLYTGDFRLAPSLTVEPADPCPADTLVMECTYGVPIFRFPDRRTVIEQLIDLVHAALRDRRQPIVLGYSLGKAQEATRILTVAGLVVTQHGTVHAISEIYQQLGVSIGAYRRYRPEDFHGKSALPLEERGVLVAPPTVSRSGFVTRFDRPCTILLSGWGLLSNAIYRYGVDHVLPISDHADFGELLQLIDRVRPKKIFTHHGPRSFADLLRAKGLDAQPAEPDRQLRLFD